MPNNLPDMRPVQSRNAGRAKVNDLLREDFLTSWIAHQATETRQREATHLIASLTARQRQVVDRVLAGQTSRNIATDLGISHRTVHKHRTNIIQKTGVKFIPALARLVVLDAQ